MVLEPLRARLLESLETHPEIRLGNQDLQALLGLLGHLGRPDLPGRSVPLEIPGTLLQTPALEKIPSSIAPLI